MMERKIQIVMKGLYSLLVIISVCFMANGCPLSQCVCNVMKEGGVEIDCSGLGWKTVPKFNSTQTLISEDYSSLILDNNKITIIPAGAFRQFRLKRLSILNNQLSGLSDESFRGLEPYLTALSVQVDESKAVRFPWKHIQKFHKLKELHLEGFITPTLPKAAVNGTVLEKLSLISNKIQFIQKGALQAVYNTLIELNLNNNLLKEIPLYQMWKLKHLQKLHLHKNKIEKIVGHTFLYMHDLIELEISENQISDLQINSFMGLGHLQYLGLHRNFLTVDSLHSLESLVNLEQLNLAMNNFDDIPMGVFSKLTKLTYLNLQENFIPKISQNLLHGAHNKLSVLLLSDNKIKEIPENTFAGFQHLETLHLDGNPLAYGLYNQSFAGLEDILKSLFLDRTGFQTSSWITIKNLRHIVVLNMCENDIDEIPKNTFQSFESLQMLLLCYNRIQSISQESFYGLDKSLKQIDLTGNRISRIPQCTFYGFSKLTDLGLVENSLFCDCHLYWLKLWVNNLEDEKKMSIDWKCLSHRNKLFRDVLPYSFRCNHTGLEHDHNAICKKPPSREKSEHDGHAFLPSIPTVKTIKFSHVGMHSIFLNWETYNSSIKVNFQRIYHQVMGDKDFTKSVPLDPDIHEYVLTDLKAKTEYTICIHVDTDNGLYLQWANCRTVVTSGGETTAATNDQQSTEPNLIIIAVSVAGVIIILIIIMTSVIICQRRRTTEIDTAKLAFVTAEMEPRKNAALKKFSKPLSQPDLTTSSSFKAPPYVSEDACKRRIFLSEVNLTKPDLFKSSTMPVATSENKLCSSSQKSIRFVNDPLPRVPPHGLRSISAYIEGRGNDPIMKSAQEIDTRSECSTHLYDEICNDTASTTVDSQFHCSFDPYDLGAYDNEIRIDETASVHL